MRRALLSVLVALALVGGASLAARAADESIGRKVDDSLITTKLKAKLSTEHAKNLVKVHVTTKDGIVSLAGVVPSEADRVEAEHLARATDGVKGVTNELTVESSPSASPSTK